MIKKAKQKGKPAVKRQTKTKAKTKAPLVRAPEECIFWCNDGCTFTDLKELAKGLAAMSDETFFHHVDLVNQGRNDFSNWVRDVFNDVELANALTKSASKDEAAACVIARLDYYQ